MVVAGTVCHRGGRADFTLTFDSSAVKGEGDSVGVVLFTRAILPPLWIADQVRNDGTSCPAGPALWIPAYAGMTGRWRLELSCCVPCPVDTALKPV